MKNKNAILIMALRHVLFGAATDMSRGIVQESILGCWPDLDRGSKDVIKQDIRCAIESGDILPEPWVQVLSRGVA